MDVSEGQFAAVRIVPKWRRHADWRHAGMLNQTANAISAITNAAPTIGEIFFVLPLRGETLGA
jgi:hypothetical protein